MHRENPILRNMYHIIHNEINKSFINVFKYEGFISTKYAAKYAGAVRALLLQHIRKTYSEKERKTMKVCSE